MGTQHLSRRRFLSVATVAAAASPALVACATAGFPQRATITTNPDTPISWLLLHGTPLSPGVWDAVRPHLTPQKVLAPDLTNVPPATAKATTQFQLATELIRQLPAGRFDIVGHSFGGQVAIELALLLNERVRSLTIFCSRDTPFPPFAAVAAGLRSGTPVNVGGGLARWFTPEELSANGPVVRYARERLTNASIPDYAAALDGIASYDRSAQVKRISAPVGLYAAGRDSVSTPDVMRNFARRLPRSAFHIIDAWAHMSPFVDPAKLATLLQATTGV